MAIMFILPLLTVQGLCWVLPVEPCAFLGELSAVVFAASVSSQRINFVDASIKWAKTNLCLVCIARMPHQDAILTSFLNGSRSTAVTSAKLKGSIGDEFAQPLIFAGDTRAVLAADFG
jgi:hypothetical protein